MTASVLARSEILNQWHKYGPEGSGLMICTAKQYSFIVPRPRCVGMSLCG